MLRKLSAVAVLLAIGITVAISQSVNRFEGQGSIWTIGGTLNIESGGTVNYKTGSTIQFGGVARTPTSGTVALDGSNPTLVNTGLSTLVACTATIVTSGAPGDGIHLLTLTRTATGQLNLYGWTTTSGADPTLVAHTGVDSVDWICWGT